MTKFTSIYGMTSRDTFNAVSGAEPVKNWVDNGDFVVRGAGIAIDTDTDTGEAKTVGYIVRDDGTIGGTISPTLIDGISALVDFMGDNETENGTTTVNCRIVERKSKQDRTFLTLSIV